MCIRGGGGGAKEMDAGRNTASAFYDSQIYLTLFCIGYLRAYIFTEFLSPEQDGPIDLTIVIKLFIEAAETNNFILIY